MSTPERPRFSESQAAKLCGVARATIQRSRKRGDIPGVEKTENGWSIPLEGLLAAGFTPVSGAGTPISQTRSGSTVRAPAHLPKQGLLDLGAKSDATDQLHRLEIELTEARAEARVLRAERDAAQAIADERQRIIALLEQPSTQAKSPAKSEEKTQQPAPKQEVKDIPESPWQRFSKRWR